MKTNIETGLSSQEISNHKSNQIQYQVSKTYKEILFQHLLTLFNGINLFLAILVFLTHSYQNMLFMVTVTINAIIGLFQEIKSKHLLDQLALLHQNKVNVLRDSKIHSIQAQEIVEGDIVFLNTGDQILCDGSIVQGNIECDESMLTGESESILKGKEDKVYAGTFVVAGQAKMIVEQVAQDTFSYSILKDVKRYKRYPSMLRDSINTIIKWCTFLIFPLGFILFVVQYDLYGYKESILSTVAAVVGMIPEGLVILTSIALALSAYRLAKQNVLVQELYCIETLSRVDTLCFDKTGTLTTGKLKVCCIDSKVDVTEILANMMNVLNDSSFTIQAIKEVTGKKSNYKVLNFIPFSSSRKYSCVQFEQGEYKLGAYEFIESDLDPIVLKKIEFYTKQAMRVLVLYSTEVLAYICLEDELRNDVKETIEYFKNQDVSLKVISGDNPLTVYALAKKAGIQGKYIDMKNIEDVSSVIDEYTIFGRVSPNQKKEMICALKEKGHIVAMTGDGVNDVMALKEADCSIAMGNGSQASKSVASLVLLDNQFEALPEILRQGRMVIHNIQRSASLFLVKTFYSIGLAILTLFLFKQYPFYPIQLTLVSALATGIPSFILTLEPNETRIKGSFLKNVISKAIPGSLCLIISIICCFIFRQFFSMSDDQFSTICTILAGSNALFVLIRVCKPMTNIRKLLVISMITCFILAILFLPNLFYIVKIGYIHRFYVIINIVSMPFLLQAFHKIGEKYGSKRGFV
ncbi:HAD-IC family P-type ATPase [Floccifex sp.]|uniref:HAD-IC family P-type ATPase n=1 Tax=Floccifex sp. TaxID=2815810 RepID=UPI003F0B9E80